MAAAILTAGPLQSLTSLTDTASRREAVASVLGTMAAEGEVPSAATLRDFECYIQGKIQLKELTSLIRRHALS